KSSSLSLFFFSSRRRHTRSKRDWSSDVCSSDLLAEPAPEPEPTPDPDPEPAPDPEPTPDPDPAPSLAPEPTPEPSPTTAPQPSDGGGAGGDTGTGTGTGGGPGGDTGGGPSTGDHSDRGDRGDLARTGVGAPAPARVAAGLLGAGGALVASRRRGGADAPAAGEEPAQSPETDEEL